MQDISVAPEVRVAENYLALFDEFNQLELYQKAEQTLLVALDKIPYHPQFLEKLAELYLRLDFPDQALKVANRLVKHHPSLKQAYLCRAAVYEQLSEESRAARDFERALTHRASDLDFLERLVQLKSRLGFPQEALDLIHTYQVILKRPTLMANLQSRINLQIGKTAAAFNTLRGALFYQPGDKQVLLDYLLTSNMTSRRSPEEIYQILQVSVPNLAELPEKDLIELQIDFARKQGDFKTALSLVKQLLRENNEHMPWRRMRAFIKLEMGKIVESVEELRLLFLLNPQDEEVRNALENYYLMQSEVGEWKALVRKAMTQDNDFLEIFNYLRNIGGNRDWLNMTELDTAGLTRSLKSQLKTDTGILDVTYKKLPIYALESFVGYLSLHHQIPAPETLWEIIRTHLSPQKQSPPFEMADLQLAYPVWLFALQFYFLFRNHTDHDVVFIPRQFQKEQVALTVTIGSLEIEIDISPVLTSEESRLRSVRKSRSGMRWRLLPPNPARRTISGIPVVSKTQFLKMLKLFKADLAEAGETI